MKTINSRSFDIPFPLFPLFSHALASLGLIVIPVRVYIGPSTHVSLAAKLANLSQISRPRLVLLPGAHRVVVRDGDEAAVELPIDGGDLALVAADEGGAGAVDGQARRGGRVGAGRGEGLGGCGW